MNNEFDDGLLELKRKFEGIVYRNIASFITHKIYLMILNDCDEEGILQKYENATSGIFSYFTAKNRAFEYALNLTHHAYSRYSIHHLGMGIWRWEWLWRMVCSFG